MLALELPKVLPTEALRPGSHLIWLSYDMLRRGKMVEADLELGRDSTFITIRPTHLLLPFVTL